MEIKEGILSIDASELSDWILHISDWGFSGTLMETECKKCHAIFELKEGAKVKDTFDFFYEITHHKCNVAHG